MEKQALKYILGFLALAFLYTGPASAEVCHASTACCVQEKASEFNFACFVNCENPPGVDQKSPAGSGGTDVPVPLLVGLVQLPRAEKTEPTPLFIPERSHSQKALLLEQSRPNPPPFA